MSTGNPVIIVRLTPDQKQVVKAEAVSQGVTISDFVRAAIRAYLLKLKNE